VELVTGHGDQCGGHYQQWFRAVCAEWQALCDPANELPHDYTCPQAYRTPIPEHLYPTTWIADRAIDSINESAESTAPFFKFVSFPDPHHPFNPPGKYWDLYSPEQFSPKIQQAMALTAGMITMIDDQIGRVVDALKVSGQFANTIIVFNSDHGDYLGDFNLLLKGAVPMRSVTQVPLIWSDPTKSTVPHTTAMASTIDLSATILERAGLSPYNGMQGRSFLNSLTTDAPHRENLFTEFNDAGSRLGFNPPARVRSLRNKYWRFTTYGVENWGELYDLTLDPNETNNLWDHPDYIDVKAECSLRMIEHLTAQMDTSPQARRRA